MGEKHPEVSQKYKKFLDKARKCYRAKKTGENFFDHKNVEMLRDALQAEVQETLNEVRSKRKEEAESQGGLARFGNWLKTGKEKGVNTVKKGVSILSKDETINTNIVDMANQTEKNTAFLNFARSVAPAINEYLNLKNFTFNTKAGASEFLKLYKVLSKHLKEYRHKAKSYHYFRSTVGRAEIANILMGGGVQPWLDNSISSLAKVGTEIDINSNQKYICRKKQQGDDDLIKAGKMWEIRRNVVVYVDPPFEA